MIKGIETSIGRHLHFGPSRRPQYVTAISVLIVTSLLCACSEAFNSEASSPAASRFDARRIAGGDPNQGRTLISRIGCGVCHEIPGIVGARGIVGPSLAAFAERQFIAGVVPNEPVTLVAWIRDAPSMVPQTAMPKLPITHEDAGHIAAYLYTLRR